MRLISADARDRWDQFERDIQRHKLALERDTSSEQAPELGGRRGRRERELERRRRRRDRRFLARLIGKRGLGGCRVLEVGAANGWLSQGLAECKVQPTALHHFADESFGLRASQHGLERWPAMQFDLLNPELLEERYPLVVINHGLHFWPDPIDLVRRWRAKVAEGGVMVLLGLSIWRDPSQRIAALRSLEQRRAGQGMTLFPLGGPGYLGTTERQRLEALEFRVRPEWAAWRGNLRAWVRPTAPLSARAVYVSRAARQSTAP